jgi:hypothetical protein
MANDELDALDALEKEAKEYDKVRLRLAKFSKKAQSLTSV